MAAPAAASCRVTDTLVATLPAAEGAALRETCGCEARCAAELAAREHPEVARLVAAGAPDTDVVRWARTEPSVGEVRPLADGRLLVRLDGFGRTVSRELREAATGAGADPGLVLDLAQNEGGDLGRMLEVAGLLLGAVPDAVHLARPGGDQLFQISGGERLPARVTAVLVGPLTASSAEVLAALLAVHGADLCGEPSAGKDYVQAVIPVDQELRLLLRVGRLEVSGVRLAGGLVPGKGRAECLVE